MILGDWISLINSSLMTDRLSCSHMEAMDDIGYQTLCSTTLEYIHPWNVIRYMTMDVSNSLIQI